MKCRKYVFTSYNMDITPAFERIQYYVAGTEVCPTTYRPHLQGYVQFIDQQRIPGAKMILGDGSIHLESQKGTDEQAIAYAKKEGRFFEYGEPSKQGKRNDLKKVIDECKTLEELMDKEPGLYCAYRQGLKDIYARKLDLSIPDVRDVDVIVYSGPTGTGKTYKAITENPGAYIYAGGEHVWFDGYDGQKVLIIDEYNGQIDYRYFLRLLDKYKMRIPIKGGFTISAWNKVIITTNASCVGAWYTTEGDISHLERRCPNWIVMDTPYK